MDKTMCTFMTTYSSFVKFLETEAPAADGSPDFETLCRRFRISPFCLEEILLEELGMTGSEVIAVYRR